MTIHRLERRTRYLPPWYGGDKPPAPLKILKGRAGVFVFLFHRDRNKNGPGAFSRDLILRTPESALRPSRGFQRHDARKHAAHQTSSCGWLYGSMYNPAMCVLDWFTKYEAVAVWLEGVALVAIFIYDRVDSRHERKAAHTDRVAAIYEKMRNFAKVIGKDVREDSFGVGKDFLIYDEPEMGQEPPEPRVMKEYLEIYEAYFASILINPRFSAYIKERRAEADALQFVKSLEEFEKRLKEFQKNWHGETMAQEMWKLL